jgi:hypothetical protein
MKRINPACSISKIVRFRKLTDAWVPKGLSLSARPAGLVKDHLKLRFPHSHTTLTTILMAIDDLMGSEGS